MLPIRREGTLESISGVQEALAVPGITAFSQTIPDGNNVVPLPEGDRYLGFLFAKALTPEDVERALSEAQGRLEITIRPLTS